MQQHRESAHGKSKARMQQHFNEVQKLVKIGKKSNSQAKHFATQFHDTNNLQHHLARQPNLCSQTVSGPVVQPADGTHARFITNGCLRMKHSRGRCNGIEMIS